MTTASDRQCDVARQYLNLSLDSTGLLAAVDVALSATGFESASVVIADDTTEYIVAQSGRTSTYPAVSPRAGTLSNESMRVGHAIIINDIDVHNFADRAAATRFGNHVAAGVRSCDAIPLRGIDHHVIGALQVLSPEPDVSSSAAVDIFHRCGAIIEILLECHRRSPRYDVRAGLEPDVDGSIADPGRPAQVNLYQPIVDLVSRDVTAVHLRAAPVELRAGGADDATRNTNCSCDCLRYRRNCSHLTMSLVAADIATADQESLARKLEATHGWGSLWGAASPADNVPDRLAALAITAASARRAATEAATGMLAQFHRCTASEAASALTLRAVLAAVSTSDMATRMVDGTEPLADS